MSDNMDFIEVKHRSGTAHVSFDAAVGIAEARALYATLGKLFPKQAAIVLHADRLERIDTAAMQVLACFCQAARQRGLAMTWQSPSAAFREAANLLGLASMLGLAS